MSASPTSADRARALAERLFDGIANDLIRRVDGPVDVATDAFGQLAQRVLTGLDEDAAGARLAQLALDALHDLSPADAAPLVLRPLAARCLLFDDDLALGFEGTSDPLAEALRAEPALLGERLLAPLARAAGAAWGEVFELRDGTSAWRQCLVSPGAAGDRSAALQRVGAALGLALPRRLSPVAQVAAQSALPPFGARVRRPAGPVPFVGRPPTARLRRPALRTRSTRGVESEVSQGPSPGDLAVFAPGDVLELTVSLPAPSPAPWRVAGVIWDPRVEGRSLVWLDADRLQWQPGDDPDELLTRARAQAGGAWQRLGVLLRGDAEDAPIPELAPLAAGCADFDAFVAALSAVGAPLGDAWQLVELAYRVRS